MRDAGGPAATIGSVRRWLGRGIVVGAVVFVLLQLLPFGRIDARPTTQEAPWPSAEARELAVAACYDCHSNEPTLEWFDRIAPGSWIVAGHVRRGREELNFSEWDREQHRDAEDGADTIADGEMPLREYVLLHPEARLSDDERRTLVDALLRLEGARRDD